MYGSQSTDSPRLVLSDRVKSICATYWRTSPRKGPDGKVRNWPANDCCKGCPLQQPCGTWTPTTEAGIDAHRKAMNDAAEQVAMEVSK